MKIQSDAQVIGQDLLDIAGNRIGSICAVTCAERYDAAWFVVRLRGLRRQYRGVPATAGRWVDRAVGVDVAADLVARSPSLTGPSALDDSLTRALAAFYSSGRSS